MNLARTNNDLNIVVRIRARGVHPHNRLIAEEVERNRRSGQSCGSESDTIRDSRYLHDERIVESLKFMWNGKNTPERVYTNQGDKTS